MIRTRIPDDVLSMAHARSRARAAHDWAEADRLKAEIEAAGWVVVDRGTDFALTPAAPPDIVEGPRTRYGSSRSVPSRLDDAPSGVATVVVVATDRAADLERVLGGLRSSAPDGTTVLIVADDPSDEVAAVVERLETPGTETVWTSVRLGTAAARNIGLRRATGRIVVILDASAEPTGDIVTPLLRALDEPSVAVAGTTGLVTADLRAFTESGPGTVDAVTGAAVAFRRADASRGPIDERFGDDRMLDIWWSLTLRDAGEEAPPRRAVALAGLPLAPAGPAESAESARPRSKRDFYRILDRFGWRTDLTTGGR